MWFSDYNTRLNAVGNSIAQSQSNASMDIVNKAFKDSPSYSVVKIDNVNYDSRVINTDKSYEKELLFRPRTQVNKGKIVVINTIENWLVTDFIYNEIYPKAKIEYCNNTLHIQTGTTQTITGYDDLGRPLIASTPVYTDLPTVVKTKINSIDDNTVINLPVGRILLSIPYSASIAEGMEFSMYGKNYFIIGIDLTNVVGITGVLNIFADRKV